VVTLIALRPLVEAAARDRLLWFLNFAAVRSIARMGSMQPELSWPYEGGVFPEGPLAIVQRTVSEAQSPALTP
jgi:hypothetical protein